MKKVVSLILIVCMLTIGATSAFAGSGYAWTNQFSDGGYRDDASFSLYLRSDGPGHAFIEGYPYYPKVLQTNTYFELYYVNSSGEYTLDFMVDMDGSNWWNDLNFDLYQTLIPIYGDEEYSTRHGFVTYSFRDWWYYDYSANLDVEISIG